MNKVCRSLNAPMCKQASASWVEVFQLCLRWIWSCGRCLTLEALHGSLLSAACFPLLLSLLAKETGKRMSLHCELSFIFMH